MTTPQLPLFGTKPAPPTTVAEEREEPPTFARREPPPAPEPMAPDPAWAAEKLYVTRWQRPHRELTALAMDEATGKVRPAFAASVRAEIRRGQKR
jgi:hypothetical protein